MVLTKELFSPQNYLELVTGECYIVNSVNSYNHMRSIMSANGLESCWDYPLDEIDHVLESCNDVVLVELYSDEGNELRWFEVPESVTKETIDKIKEEYK